MIFTPEGNAQAHPDLPLRAGTGNPTFIGDYFGSTVAANGSGQVDYTTLVTTYDDGTNPAHRQQQLVASVPVP
ncbi:hypothetical protein ACFY2W_08355 [Streptomyces sp. NPDC001262]|uniref:hypothetical protein n=1 Tax=Streptomyces sp. NPDC001262 TaxID=3364552 RepID=UPI00367C1B46